MQPLDKTTANLKTVGPTAPQCHIDSIRSMALLVTQMVIKSSRTVEHNKHVEDLVAFCLNVALYMSRHIKKVAVLYNLLLCVNYVGAN